MIRYMMMAAAILAIGIVTACARLEPKTVTIKGMTKTTVGTLQKLVSGDRACYVYLNDTKGRPFDEMALFEICDQKDLIGKRVRLSYKRDTVIAYSCQGNPECKDSENVVLIDSMKEAR